MPLTNTSAKSAKPRDKTYRLSDEKGMYLEITPQGGKYWRLKYRVDGREKRLSLGVYPTVSLAEARRKRDEARVALSTGVDPSAQKVAAKRTAQGADRFETIAEEWFVAHSRVWASSHADKVHGRLRREIYPWLGNRPIREISAPHVLEVLRRIEARGHIETAHRTHQVVSRVFRYAISTGRTDRDPAADLRGALKPAVHKSLAAVTEPAQVGALLRAIDSFSGKDVVRCALRLAPLVFVRPGELRGAQWSEVDLPNAEWRIPETRMKGRRAHLVPLSRQAVTIFSELWQVTGPSGFVFPSARSRDRSMSENALTAALRRLGYGGDEMTWHGFRSIASTLLNEQGWNPDAIERQLAHAPRDGVRAAYNHAQYAVERREMMQSWADYLDALRKSNQRGE